MATDRKLLIGAVSLVRGRVRGDLAALSQAGDAVEALLLPEFFEHAPFDRISLILRYGDRTQLCPEYQRIQTIDGTRELPIAVELEMSRLRRIAPLDVVAIFHQAMLDALIAVAVRYGLPAERLREARLQTPAVIEDGSRGSVDSIEPPAA